MQKSCSECGTTFECQNETRGCWCEELPAVMPLADGAQCLCPACLKTKIECVEAWNAISGQYADKYQDEILLKPKVQEFIADLLKDVPANGLVCDMGCGPGQVARYVKQTFDRNVCGVDLAPEMIAQATKLNPGISFEAKDVLTMRAGEIYDAVIGLYFIVNFQPERLPLVFEKLHQLLKPGGKLLLSFHIGTNNLHREDDLWNSGKGLSFYFFDPQTVKQRLEEAGFVVEEVRIREPYPEVEYASKRAYVFSRRLR